MLLGNDLLELIGTLDDPDTVPGADDATALDDAPPGAEVPATAAA